MCMIYAPFSYSQDLSSEQLMSGISGRNRTLYGVLERGV